MIVLASGARPTLAQPIAWWDLDKQTAARIRASIDLHDPQAETTLAAVDRAITVERKGQAQ